MKLSEQREKGGSVVWQGLCFLLGALLLVDFAVCAVAAAVAVGWLLMQLELAVVTAVLLLAGILVFLLARRAGVTKLPRRLLGAGLICGSLILLFFGVAYGAMLLYVAQVS